MNVRKTHRLLSIVQKGSYKFEWMLDMELLAGKPDFKTTFSSN